MIPAFAKERLLEARIPRFAAEELRALTEISRVTFVAGPRQSGKTTLVKGLGEKYKYFSLDDPTTLAAAQNDPMEFIAGKEYMVIDEIQKEPRLLTVIKMSVDDNQRTGHFVLTSSTMYNIGKETSDPLVGRKISMELFPLSQAELHGKQPSFIDRIFSQDASFRDLDLGESGRTGFIMPNLVDKKIALYGGFPDALRNLSWVTLCEWGSAYARDVVGKDLPNLVKRNHVHLNERFIDILAMHAGKQINYASIAKELQLDPKTVKAYIILLEELFLVRTLPQWQPGWGSKHGKGNMPKLHFIDTGIVASLINLDPAFLSSKQEEFGCLFDNFVFAEILKLVSFEDDPYELSYFRQAKGDHEVDLVIENSKGEIVGIETKASTIVGEKEFKGLRKLKEASEDKFKLGIVFHTSDRAYPFGEKMMMLPLTALWN